MAKSPVGGSRAYLKGRIGSDVYSLGKDGKGKRQQVVRALAEQVSNPRTESQMFGRMIMSTIMQTAKALGTIIDHSFDGVPVGQPSVSEFIRRNYKLVKDDATAHYSGSNIFGLNKYQEKGAKAGAYVVSYGKELLPENVAAGTNGLVVALTATTKTVGGLKAAWNVYGDDYITLVHIGDKTGALYVRCKLETALADSTALTDENLPTMFTFEGNFTPSVSLSTNNVVIAVPSGDTDNSAGAIVSRKVNGVWKHSACQLFCPNPPAWNRNAALPTYPTGTEMFLNGGDL